MLVKVRNDDPSRLSSTERTVVNWLKSWTGSHALSGIAVVKAHGADLIVWTPRACVVVVVKGFTERRNGPLTVADTAPWTIDGHIAPLEGVQTGTEPMDELRTRTTEIERVLRAAPGRQHVAVMGVVLVIPHLGTRVSLEKGALAPGLDVVVGDGPSSLRAYFTQLTGANEAEGGAGTVQPRPDAWDAAQVSQALGALGFAAAATYSDLVAEGFPPPRGDRTGGPSGAQTAAAAQAPASAGTPAPAPGSGTPPTGGAPIPLPGRSAPPPGGQQAVPTREYTAATPAYGSAAPYGSPAPAAGSPAPAYGSPGPAYGSPAPAYGSSGPAYGSPAPDTPRRRRSSRRESAAAAAGYGASGREGASGPGASQREFASGAPSFAPGGFSGGPPSYNSPAQPYSVPFEPRPPKPPRARGRGIVPLVLLALLVLILATVAMCTGGNDDKPSTPAPAPGTRTTQSTAPHTTAPDITIPSETPAPACFPLQPDCPPSGPAAEPAPPAEPPVPAEQIPPPGPAPAEQLPPPAPAEPAAPVGLAVSPKPGVPAERTAAAEPAPPAEPVPPAEPPAPAEPVAPAGPAAPAEPAAPVEPAAPAAPAVPVEPAAPAELPDRVTCLLQSTCPEIPEPGQYTCAARKFGRTRPSLSAAHVSAHRHRMPIRPTAALPPHSDPEAQVCVKYTNVC
ncbi:hypothetical protein [Nocardia sp. N2S4-5]|uniref:hypothetical protein n=1 Tax=Nocardia sp. N2S4-5 TaxID=3351565 RepID=UPI0037D49CF9